MTRVEFVAVLYADLRSRAVLHTIAVEVITQGAAFIDSAVADGVPPECLGCDFFCLAEEMLEAFLRDDWHARLAPPVSRRVH